MMNLIRSHQRGNGNHGWLRSKHTFSFGDYHNDNAMGFSALRVINEDEVVPEAGFPTHGHSDMEIISYVLEGEIAHRDSEGNVTRLPAGEFQLMSAGKGIRHSEFNPSSAKKLHFLQIWITPNVRGQQPGYQQKDFGQAPGLTLVISPDGSDGSLHIKQDARLYQLLLSGENTAELTTQVKRNYYVHAFEGAVIVKTNTGEWETLAPGDGVKIGQVEQLHFSAKNGNAKALVFDLP